MTEAKKQKLSKIVWPLVYLALIGTICFSGCLVFKRYYYCSVFVSGSSMDPTLKGGIGNGEKGTADFGIVDTSVTTIKKIKRFDIVTAYYPWDSNDYKQPYQIGQAERNGAAPERKIKRMIGMSNETIGIYESNIVISETPHAVTPSEFVAGREYKLGASGKLSNVYKTFYFEGINQNFLYMNYNFDTATRIKAIEKDGEKGKYDLKFYYDDLDDWAFINLNGSGSLATISWWDLSGTTDWVFNTELNTFVATVNDNTFCFGLKDANGSQLDIVNINDFKDLSLNYKVCQFMDRDNSKSTIYYETEDDLEKLETLPQYKGIKDGKKLVKISFNRNFSGKERKCKDISEVHLQGKQYWVMGDHWSNSTDSHTNGPIYLENIEGKLVAIEGTCTISTSINSEGKTEKVCKDHVYGKPIIL